MMGILGVFAQMEREITAERVSAAMLERALQGKRTCHNVLGYDHDGADSLKINPDEAETVKFIFDKFIEYRNLSAVADVCNLNGFRSKKGNPFKVPSIKKILNHSVYTGYYPYKGKLYKGNFEPIVDIKKFDRVQKILAAQGRPHRKSSI